MMNRDLMHCVCGLQDLGGLSARMFKMQRAVLFSLALMSGIAFAGSDEEPGIWHTDFKKAEALASENGVPLLVHFHASWCGPCRAMEADVLSSADVREALKSGIVGVKVDSDVHRDLVARFGVTALPTDIIVSVDGRVLSKNVGSPGRQAYVARLLQHSVPAGGSDAPASEQNIAVAQNGDVEVPAPATSAPAAAAEEAVGSVPVSGSVADAEKPALAMTKILRRDDGLRVGLNGYSPVLLAESEKWKTGDVQFRHEFQGVSYLCASEEELNRFKASPEKFIPALHGCDPVALAKDQVLQSGHVELGVTYKSRVYFFTTAQNRDEFLSNPVRFSGTYSLAFFETDNGNDT